MAVVTTISGSSDSPLTAMRVEGAASRALSTIVGVHLVSQRGLERPIAAALVDRTRQCGSDLVCAATAFRAAGAQLGLVVGVNLAFEPAFLTLNLVDVGSLSRVAHWSGDVPREAAALEGAIATELPGRLSTVGYVSGGRSVVTVAPREAGVRLGRETPSTAGPAFTVRPGSYEVIASHPDLETARQMVDVAAGQSVQVELTLTEGSVASSPWLWIGLAAAVVAGGAVTAAVLAGQSEDRCVCVTLPGDACAGCP